MSQLNCWPGLFLLGFCAGAALHNAFYLIPCRDMQYLPVSSRINQQYTSLSLMLVKKYCFFFFFKWKKQGCFTTRTDGTTISFTANLTFFGLQSPQGMYTFGLFWTRQSNAASRHNIKQSALWNPGLNETAL